MKTLYRYFCWIEETVVKVFLCAIVFFVFSSALGRTLRHPINWAVDLSLLLFAWLVFLGADMALRNINLVNVDLFIKKVPPNIRRKIDIVLHFVILVFLASLVWFGIPLAIESSKRLFQTLGISYSWATVSVPIGAVLMMISTGINIYKALKMPPAEKR